MTIRLPRWLTSRAAWHRAAAMVVFAMQAAFATAAVWEPHPFRRIDTHIEADGTRDVGHHSDDACPICSIAAMAAEPTDAPHPEVTRVVEVPAALRATRSPNSVATGQTRSRAPPAIAG